MLLERSVKSFLDISQLRTRQLRDRSFFILLSLFSTIAISAALFFISTYIFALIQNFIAGGGIVSQIEFRLIMRWTIVGVVISSLSVLLAWPCAIATAVVLEQEESYWVRLAQKFISWLASLPLIVYAYVFVQFMAVDILGSVKGFWLESFASVNWVTQLLAFAGTIFLYPLLLFIPNTDGVTIDQFFRGSLKAILNFGEQGLTVTLLCFGLTFVILPRMIFEIQKMIRGNKDLQSLEIVRSLGGTIWESMHITLIHSMKSRFSLIFVRFVRYSFFEGIVVFLLVGYTLSDQNITGSTVGTTISSVVVREYIGLELSWPDLLSFGGWLLLLHIAFVRLESYIAKRRRS